MSCGHLRYCVGSKCAASSVQRGQHPFPTFTPSDSLMFALPVPLYSHYILFSIGKQRQLLTKLYFSASYVRIQHISQHNVHVVINFEFKGVALAPPALTPPGGRPCLRLQIPISRRNVTKSLKQDDDLVTIFGDHENFGIQVDK